MNCPHCGKKISRKQVAAGLGKIKSERKAKTSAENGKLGGRPKKQGERFGATKEAP